MRIVTALAPGQGSLSAAQERGREILAIAGPGVAWQVRGLFLDLRLLDGKPAPGKGSTNCLKMHGQLRCWRVCQPSSSTIRAWHDSPASSWPRRSILQAASMTASGHMPIFVSTCLSSSQGTGVMFTAGTTAMATLIHSFGTKCCPEGQNSRFPGVIFHEPWFLCAP